jgi:hypothetical protein
MPDSEPILSGNEYPVWPVLYDFLTANLPEYEGRQLYLHISPDVPPMHASQLITMSRNTRIAGILAGYCVEPFMQWGSWFLSASIEPYYDGSEPALHADSDITGREPGLGGERRQGSKPIPEFEVGFDNVWFVGMNGQPMQMRPTGTLTAENVLAARAAMMRRIDGFDLGSIDDFPDLILVNPLTQATVENILYNEVGPSWATQYRLVPAESVPLGEIVYAPARRSNSIDEHMQHWQRTQQALELANAPTDQGPYVPPDPLDVQLAALSTQMAASMGMQAEVIAEQLRSMFNLFGEAVAAVDWPAITGLIDEIMQQADAPQRPPVNRANARRTMQHSNRLERQRGNQYRANMSNRPPVQRRERRR